MDNLFPVQVHESDNDAEHMQVHMAHFQQTGGDLGDPEHLKRGHILEHIKAMKAKAAKAMGAQQPPQGGSPQGQPGAPRPGGQAQMPTGPQQPPGAMHPDTMPMAMPRR
jgi:hypothetical protein